ncbi:MAG TPA: acyltransferase, partial [Polyangiales bacterium]
MESPDRYRSLDAIRGIAAFGVMIFHYANHFGTAPFLSMRQLGWVYRRGSILVDVFFVMSGYLLATIYAGRRDVGTLIWRRVARLVPLHWLMLGVVTLLQMPILRRHGVTFVYLNYDPYHFLLNLLLLHCSGLGNGFSFDGPAWSISVEWIVNLALFPLLWLRRNVLALVASGIALGSALVLW